MQRILGLFISTAMLASACGDDDTTSTSSNTVGETGMTTDDSATEATLSSDATIDDTSSEAGSGSNGSSEGGSSSEAGSSSEGGSSDGGSSDGSDTSMCEPITDDPSAIGTTCEVDGDCLDGYTCYDGGGIASMPLCQIMCTQDCECPAGYTCEHMNIKGNEWDQCNPG